MKVLYLKDYYDISLIITVPDVAYLKKIKRANRLFVYIRITLPPPNKLIEKLWYAWYKMFRIVIIFKA
jgi:translation elongation factor EF-4